MSAPELTPERLSEIKILLGIAAGLGLLIALPFVANWWLERKIRIMRSAYQYYCHRCRRGTDRREGKCIECSASDAMPPKPKTNAHPICESALVDMADRTLAAIKHRA